MTDRVVCFGCGTPVQRDKATRRIDGELYHSWCESGLL